MKTFTNPLNRWVDAINENRWLKILVMFLGVFSALSPLLTLFSFLFGLQMPSFYWPNELLIIIFSITVFSLAVYIAIQNKEIHLLKKQIESLTTYTPHTAGFLQRDNFFYCQSHNPPALLGVGKYDPSELKFVCTNCNKDWSYPRFSENFDAPITHQGFCQQFQTLTPHQPENSYKIR